MHFDFPLFKDFEVDSEFVSFMNRKYRDYILSNGTIHVADQNVYISPTGCYTSNLLEWENEEYEEFAEGKLMDIASEQLGLDKSQFYLHHNHIFDYQGSGFVRPHNHEYAEDFVLLFYLNTCTSGETVFILNNSRPWNTERTSIKITPVAGRAVCFSSLLVHRVEPCTEGKRIFAVGIKINAFKGI